MAVAATAEINSLLKLLFFTKLKKKTKNIGRGLKNWGIVQNGLYFENIEKKKKKK